ncbi:hypothetical protein D9M70_538910 [compost metagenome]
MPPKSRELMICTRASRLRSPPTTLSERSAARTGVARVMINCWVAASTYGSVRVVPPAARASLYQGRVRGS